MTALPAAPGRAAGALWRFVRFLALAAAACPSAVAAQPSSVTLERVSGYTYRLPAGLQPGTYTIESGGGFTVAPPDAGPDVAPDVSHDAPVDAPVDRCAGRSVAKPPRAVPSAPIVTVPAGSNLQAIIDSSAAGSSLVLAAGEWREHLLTRGKAIRIFGSGRGVTVLAGVNGPTGTRTGALLTVTGAGAVAVADLTLTGGVRAIDAQTSNATLVVSNVEITGNGIGDAASAHRGSGIFARTTTLDVRESWIHDNIGAHGAGLNTGSGLGASVTDSVIERNVSYADHGGAGYFNGPTVLVCNEWRANEVGRYVAGTGWGSAFIVNGTGATVTSELQVIVGNLAGNRGAFFVDEGAHGTSHNDTVSGNGMVPGRTGSGTGVYVDGTGANLGSVLDITGLAAIGNTGTGIDGGNGVYVSRNSRVTVAGSVLHNGDDWYVRTSDGSTLSVSSTVSDETPP